MEPFHHERRIQTVCLLVIATVAIGFAMHWLRPVMIPFVLALFFALALTPLIDLQIRHLRAPRPVALVATLFLGAVLLGLLWMLVSASVTQMLVNREAYQQQFVQLVERVLDLIPHAPVPAEVEAVSGAGGEAAGGALPSVPPARVFDAKSLVSAEAVRNILVGTTNAIMGVLSQGLLVLIFTLFLLIGRGLARPRAGTVRFAVESQVKRYVGTKFLTSAITGILVGSVLSILGVDLALVFGLFAFLLNFIPNVGSFIATLLPLPVVLVSRDISLATAVLAIAIPGAIQFSIGNIVEPKLMGQSLDLHPVVILLALILWGMIWGLVGMLLAAPITAVVKIMLEKSEITAPVAHLLAGRWPEGEGEGDGRSGIVGDMAGRGRG